MMVVCMAEQRAAMVKSPAFGTGTVEVTYRFDDQPAVREQWALSEGLAASRGAADPILMDSRRSTGWCSALAVVASVA